MNALHQKDCYKIGHIQQYPENTNEIYSNETARSGKLANIPNSKGIYFVTLQYFILDYLIDDWNISFFNKDKYEVVSKYKRRVSNILKYEVDVSHIEALHDLGYLPIIIKSLPEGSFVPYGVPFLTIKNTLPEFFWLTNMLESVMSAELWQPITSATTYMAYKKLFHKFAEETGSSKEFIPYQGHDFSFRGMPGRHAAAISGFAVLAAGCVGTDCIPAIDIAEDYYGADSDLEVVGESVNATEHSVCSSNIIVDFTTNEFTLLKEEFLSKKNYEGELDNKLVAEYGFIKNLLTSIYPTGFISNVSDTFDFFSCITEVLPRLKDEILNRDGKFICRPDSGDPVDIICGHGDDTYYNSPEYKGLIECLWDVFGGTINPAGYKVLGSHIGAIYGDSITYERAEQILTKLKAKGFASENIVFGIGSYTYQMCTRDTHGMAMKATHAIINGVHTPIFKEPKTGDGLKKSAKGYLMVAKEGDTYKLWDNIDSHQEKHGCLETVFKDGKLVKRTTLKEIRELTKIE